MHCLFNSIERTTFYSWTCATSLKLDSTYKICWLDLFLFFCLQCWGLNLGPCIHWASALPQNNISKQLKLILIVGQLCTVTGRIPVSSISQPSLLSPSLSLEPPFSTIYSFPSSCLWGCVCCCSFLPFSSSFLKCDPLSLIGIAYPSMDKVIY